jgi:hypothetical protein
MSFESETTAYAIYEPFQKGATSSFVSNGFQWLAQSIKFTELESNRRDCIVYVTSGSLVIAVALVDTLTGRSPSCRDGLVFSRIDHHHKGSTIRHREISSLAMQGLNVEYSPSEMRC